MAVGLAAAVMAAGEVKEDRGLPPLEEGIPWTTSGTRGVVCWELAG